MTRAGIILLIAVAISLFLSLGITFPVSSNEEKENKTIKHRIQQHYSEPIHFGEYATTRASGDEIPEGSLEAKLEIDHAPKIGETAHLTLTIISHWDFPEVRIEIGMGRLENVDKEAGIQLISGLEEFQKSEEREGSSYHYAFFCQLGDGESRTFNFTIKVTNEGLKYIRGGVEQYPQRYWEQAICASDGYYLRIDDLTSEISRNPFPPPPEYWVSPLMQGNGPFGGVERMREDMQIFIKAAPELTKWEARWLVDKAERHSCFPYEIDESLAQRRKEWLKNERDKGHDVMDPLVLRRILIDEMIKMAKLRAMTERKELHEVLRDEIIEWKKSRPEEVFIVPNDGENSKTVKGRADSVTVKGYFKFKKHLYDTSGLDTTTIDTPIRRALVWIWENAPTPTYIGRCLTDNNGYFERKVQAVGSGEHHVYVVVHTTGPNYTAPEAYKIKVISDTVEQYPSSPPEKYWRENTDPKIVYNGGTANFGEYYFGTRHQLYPQNPQPRSGAANIFNALLEGYEFLVDSLPSLGIPPYYLAVYAIWEEGYHSHGRYTSCYVGNDSIKICAGKQGGTGTQLNTDEWDDDVLLHEFGHFLMDRFAELKIGGGGYWAKDYDDLNGAWEEAWAYLFSSIARNDYFFVNTHHGIGNNSILSYYNLENENDFWYQPCPDSMEGGGGCIDAISASLWDFRDATNESWPDGRQDRMTVSFEEIWDVFDNYDPYPYDTLKNHCVDIYDFWNGYVYGYNHASWVKEIFNHHKIGLNMVYMFSATGGNQKVDLDWRLKLYGQKERSANIFYIYRSDWEFGPFSLVDSVDYVPPETLYSYSDTSVQYAMPYWYKLGIVDSAGLESESEVDSGIPFNLPSPPSAPSPVTNFSAFDTPFDQGGSITLTWTKSANDSIITNYYIFRSWYSGERYYCIDSVGQGIETYVDMNTADGDTFYYIVRAHNGVNGSNSSEEWAISQDNRVASADNPFATAFGKKLIFSTSGRIHLVWSSWDRINYIYSDNKGGYWSEIQDIGEGEYPSIALDSNGKPNVVWMWYSPQGYPTESRLYFSRKTPSGWTTPYKLWEYPYTSGVPCFSIDESDTGRVVWDSYTLETEGHSAISFGTFYTQAISPAFHDTIIDDDGAPPGCKNPSIAIDSVGFRCHVVYSKDDNIYYTIVTTSSSTTPRRISDSSGNSLYPYIEYDKDSGKLHVVWQQKKGGKYQIMHCAKGLFWLWPKPVVACSTGYNSVNPVITNGEYIVWSEEVTDNSEIYYSRYNGISWGDPVLVKNTLEASRYPQVTHTSGADSDTVFVAWTDGDSLPYTIEFQQLNFAKTVLFSGHISENTTWLTDILIKGDVWVDTGVTLAIDAGVNVKFIPNFDNEHSGIDPTRAEFIIQGGLVLLGNDSLPISFTSNAPQSEIGDWYGIRFIESESKGIQERDFARPTDDKRADIDLEPVEKEMEFLTGEASSLTKTEVRQDALPVVDNAVDVDLGFTEDELIVEIRRERQRSDKKKDTSRRRNIHYLEIEHAKTGLVFCKGEMLSIKNCVFRKNEIGLKLTGKSDVSVTNSVFEDNTIYGIFIGDGVTGNIKDCTVSLNSTGIIFSGSTSSKAKELDIEENATSGYISNLSNLSIRNSKIINNYDYGIYITNDAEPDLGGRGFNYIYGSGLFDLYNNTNNIIMAKMNYWGTMDVDSGKVYIYDYFDDNSLGIVEIEPLWNGEKSIGNTMTSGEGRTPLIYSLKHPSPNPFVNNTTIFYSIAKPGNVSLDIYDISGRLVKTLINEKKDACVHNVRWNGCNDDNRKVATGVYFIRLTSGDFTSVKKIILVR